jgi:hypothetical protein
MSLNPVLMVIAHVVPKQAPKMTLVQGNHMIQELTAAASDPALGGSILLGARTLVRFGIKPVACNKVNHRIVELGVSIQDRIAIGAGFRKRIP